MKWHREPLVHFLALGVGLFLLHGAVAAPVREEAVINLSAGDIEQSVRIFEKTFQRPPTEAEMNGLIEERIRDEVFYRQALAMGLDKDDTLVRRRLRQKVEFLFNDIAGLVEPTESDLADYLEEHADAYRRASRVSFRQVYLNRNRRGDAVLDEAERLLAMLEADPDVDVDTLGDRLLQPGSFESVTDKDVSKRFGSAFAGRLAQLPSGTWVGPVESGYGLHLVHVSERWEGELPELAEVREFVERDWSAASRKKSTRAYYQGLRERYTVNVERPEGQEQVAKVSPPQSPRGDEEVRR